MNAISENDFVKTLRELGERLPKPEAVLCISAHWMTEGSWITHMEKPRTIHDFYGFPQELFDVQYPAPGSQEISEFIQSQVKDPQIQLDDEIWGLDHGTWSVLRHIFPRAEVPVLQLSLYMEQPPSYHFKLGRELSKLRENGILIVGSGNVVHNLRRISWEENAEPFSWAVEFDQWLKEKILERDHQALQNEVLKSEAGKLSVPTWEHYYPLLYCLAASGPSDKISFEFEEIQNASISMRSISFGLQE